MNIEPRDLLRTLRSASFNDEAAAELLLELGRLAPTADLAYRILDVASHMSCDAKALERIYQAMATQQLALLPTRR